MFLLLIMLLVGQDVAGMSIASRTPAIGEIIHSIQSTTLNGDTQYSPDKAYDDDTESRSITNPAANPWYRAWLNTDTTVMIMSLHLTIHNYSITNEYTVHVIDGQAGKRKCSTFGTHKTGRHEQIVGCGLEGVGFEISLSKGGSKTELRIYDLKLDILL